MQRYMNATLLTSSVLQRMTDFLTFCEVSNKITNLSFNIAQKHSARAFRHNSCRKNLLKIDKSNPEMELYFGKVASLNQQLCQNITLSRSSPNGYFGEQLQASAFGVYFLKGLRFRVFFLASQQAFGSTTLNKLDN